MRVHFILPTPGDSPVGGYKVVYEYANHLCRRGWEVVVSHLPRPDPASLVRRVSRVAKDHITGRWKAGSWFQMDPRVELRLLRGPRELRNISADAVFATAWQTAPLVAGLPASCGDKYYLIQHFEEWSGDKQDVLQTWRLPLAKVVIARWLADIAAAQGQHSHYVPNGLDFNAFGLDRPLGSRATASVIMLHHAYNWKGSAEGLAALRLVKERIPSLSVQLFGVTPAPPGLEPWFRYVQRPTQVELRRLYNEAAIFVSPSWSEGWPLPPAEAMACGAADVLTDIGGHREYAEHGITAMLCPPRQPAALAYAVEELCRDPERRIAIAEAGYRNILNFTWERATETLVRIVQARQRP